MKSWGPQLVTLVPFQWMLNPRSNAGHLLLWLTLNSGWQWLAPRESRSLDEFFCGTPGLMGKDSFTHNNQHYEWISVVIKHLCELIGVITYDPSHGICPTNM